MNLSLYTIQRIKRVLLIAVVTGIGITFFTVIENKSFEDFEIGFLVGVILGIPIGILEEFIVINKFKKMPFVWALVMKGILYTVGVGIFFIGFYDYFFRNDLQ